MRKILASSVFAILATVGGSAAAENGVFANRIVIGQTITLQGGANAHGMAVVDGVQSVFERVNRNGGIHGRRLEVRLLDDENRSDQAAENARKLIEEERVFLVFGSIEGGPSTAVMNVTTQAGVPFFGPMAGSPTLREPHQPLVFPVRADHTAEFRTILQYAKSIGLTRAAFLRADSGGGEAHLSNVQRILAELEMELVADLPFQSGLDDEGVAAIAIRIGESDAQVVFNHGVGIFERVIRAAKARGVNAYFFGINSGSFPIAQSLDGMSRGMVFAQVVPSPWQRKNAITRSYQETFSAYKPDEPFSYSSMEGYLTARALVESLRLAGPELTREGFVAALRNVDLQIEDMTISYRPGNHVGMDWLDISVVTRDGEFRH
jgi:ABC-type branched-subunit amino acid transport system substrate-binding protein